MKKINLGKERLTRVLEKTEIEKDKNKHGEGMLLKILKRKREESV